MTWLPISGDLPQYTVSGEQANGYVLKFYEVGTTTPLTVSSSSTGSPTTTDFLLDTQGYLTLSSVKVIPHVQTAYKLIMYLNQTDADADDTGSAVWTIDNISLASVGSLIAVDNVTALAAISTSFFQTAYVKGTTTLADGGQGTFYYDSTSVLADNGTTIIAPDVGTGRWLKLAVNSVTRRVVTASETYTPAINLSLVEFELVGGGGGSGGAAATGGAQTAVAGGGGGGGYVKHTTSTIAASYTITIGAAGTAGAAGDNDGGAGGDTIVTDGASFTLTASGGGLGEGAAAAGSGAAGSGGAATGGTMNVRGDAGDNSATGDFNFGGASFPQKRTLAGGANADGIAGADYGAGAAGAYNSISQSARAGAAGGAGVLIITEYL